MNGAVELNGIMRYCKLIWESYLICNVDWDLLKLLVIILNL